MKKTTGPAVTRCLSRSMQRGDNRATPPKSAAKTDPKLVERGRYLVKIAGCNDCHTPGYMASAGKVPEAQWLTGDKLGWRGPWGTTYAINLRLYMKDVTEAEWLKRAKTMETRPPMPWFALRDMTERDLKAIYHYVKAQPVAGEPAPALRSARPGAEGAVRAVSRAAEVTLSDDEVARRPVHVHLVFETDTGGRA